MVGERLSGTSQEPLSRSKGIDGFVDGEEIGILLRIDPATKPTVIDLKVAGEGAEKGRTLEGIFQVEGDTLRLCFYEKSSEKRRLIAFPKEPDPDLVLYVCKRVKR
jgi:hypothetical protein